MSRAQLTSTVEQNTGGAVAPFVAGKNKIINGDFAINQRGFTSTSTSGTYGFDRWTWEFSQTSGTAPVYSAQAFTPGTAPVAGYEGTNYAQLVSSGQSTAGDYTAIVQRIENVRTFAGQTVTISFWAKTTSGTAVVGLGGYQSFGTGGSALAFITPPTPVTISSNWARYSQTFTLPSIAGKTIGTASFVHLYLFTSAGSTISGYGYPVIGIQNNTFSFWGVQLEAGSVATPFTTATGTLSGELAACQRYYWRDTAAGTSSYVTGFSPAGSTGGAFTFTRPPVNLRIFPTALDYSAIVLDDGYSANYALTSLALASGYSSTNQIALNASVSSGLTSGKVYGLRCNASTGYIGLSAEL